MTKLPTRTASSMEAFLADAGPRLASLCTACGACFDACPAVDLLGRRNADAKAVTADLRRLATGQRADSEVATAWAGACCKSGLCIAACPERERGLDAMLLVRIARQQAINRTKQLPAKHDATAFPRVKAFARLQLTDEEQKQWL